MTEAVVVGGGPAGAALATRLARAGREVVLLEREAAPSDKVCGEFLSREAALYLASLGLDLAALGAVPIDALRLCEGDRIAVVDLPFRAWSLSRRVLDETLLGLASAAGATVRRGAKVQRLERGGRGWSAHLEAGTVIRADAAFLATGKHDLHGCKRPPGLQNDLVAFKRHYRLSREQTAALSGYVELVLFDGGYAGLSLVEEERANLCLVVRKRRLSAVGQSWSRLLSTLLAGSSHLDARLRGAATCTARPLALAAIPYGYVRRRTPGIWHLGDQAAVIPSFSGDGMSIALHSADLAAAAFLAGEPAAEFQCRLARDVTIPVLLSTAISQGLVRSPAQVVLGAAARLAPGLMATIATLTRVSDAALARVGLHDNS